MDTTQAAFTTRCLRRTGVRGLRLLFERLRSVGDSEVRRYQQSAEQALFRMGITFNVYGDEAGTEKIFPFDGPDLLGKILP